MIGLHPKKIAGLGISLAILASGLCLAAADDPIVALIKMLFRPFAEQAQLTAAENQFIDKTRNCLVITNESQGDWRFGFTTDLRNELKDPPSGTLQVTDTRYGRNGIEMLSPVTLGDGNASFTIPGRYHTVAITPVCTRTRVVFWEKFARVCYLEDSAGKRIYLTLTKDTPAAAVPQVGISGASAAVLNAQKVVHFTDKALQQKNFNMIGIQVDQLK